MKRFLLFGCDEFQPQGGWQDFIGACEDLEEADKLALSLINEDCNGIDYVEYVDINSLKIVKKMVWVDEEENEVV